MVGWVGGWPIPWILPNGQKSCFCWLNSLKGFYIGFLIFLKKLYFYYHIVSKVGFFIGCPIRITVEPLAVRRIFFNYNIWGLPFRTSGEEEWGRWMSTTSRGTSPWFFHPFSILFSLFHYFPLPFIFSSIIHLLWLMTWQGRPALKLLQQLIKSPLADREKTLNIAAVYKKIHLMTPGKIHRLDNQMFQCILFCCWELLVAIGTRACTHVFAYNFILFYPFYY